MRTYKMLYLSMSLSLRERGLKSDEPIWDKEKKWSLSLRERGLKSRLLAGLQ